MGRMAAVLLSLFLLAGCGYQLGSIKIGEGQKIAVPTFENKTGEPDLETRVTNAIIKRLQIDGSYRVVADAREADYVLQGALASYRRDAVAFDRSDVTREYRTILSADIVFLNAGTLEEMWRYEGVEGEVIFSRGSDQGESERASVPQLSEDLAKFVVEKVVNQGW